MKVTTIYSAEDGKRFDSAKDCEQYEAILHSTDNIMKRLRNNSTLKHGCAIQQDRQTVESCLSDFLELCEKAIPTEAKVFKECKEGKRHISHAEHVIGEYSNDYPCLEKAMRRFACIHMDNGIEYDMPYFANTRYFLA